MTGLNGDDWARLLYLTLLLMFLLVAGRSVRRTRWGEAAKMAIAWLAIIVGLVAVYAYREPLLRLAAPVVGELVPRRVAVLNEGEALSIARSGDGHYRVYAEIDGHPVDMLVDTGASTLALRYEDAMRAGIDPRELRFISPIRTANGSGLAAPVRIERLQIGPYEVREVRGTVLAEGMLEESLLGMNVLEQFSSWRVENNRFVLVP